MNARNHNGVLTLTSSFYFQAEREEIRHVSFALHFHKFSHFEPDFLQSLISHHFVFFQGRLLRWVLIREIRWFKS